MDGFVTQRLVLVSATVGLLVLSALLYPRQDGGLETHQSCTCF